MKQAIKDPNEDSVQKMQVETGGRRFELWDLQQEAISCMKNSTISQEGSHQEAALNRLPHASWKTGWKQ